MLAPEIFKHANSFAIGLYLAALGALSTVCVLLLPETGTLDVAKLSDPGNAPAAIAQDRPRAM